MQKIASPPELRSELQRLLAMCQGPERPSREQLAHELRGVAARLASTENALELPKQLARAFTTALNSATQDSVVGSWKARDAGANAEAGWLELTSGNTSDLTVKVRLDRRGKYELTVDGYFNGSQEANRALDKILNGAKASGDANAVARAIHKAPQIVGQAFEAALAHERTSSRIYDNLNSVAADLKRNALALLKADGWTAEVFMSQTIHDGKAALYGTLDVIGLPPQDKVQVNMAKAAVKKAINATVRKHRDYASIFSNGRAYFSSNELNMPLKIVYMA